MKLFQKLITVLIISIVALSILCSCGGKHSEKDILVVARDASSGTRLAFENTVQNSSGIALAQGGSDGKSGLLSTADLQNSTGNVRTKIASNINAIGYISLSSINDSIKALKIDGVEATAANVTSGNYKIFRPFVLMVKRDAMLTAATADFFRYLQSSSAQNIIENEGFVRYDNAQDSAPYSAPTTPLSGKVIVVGSSSVAPSMDKLIADYYVKGGNNVKDVTIEKQGGGSSVGINAAKSDTVGNIIGMSSSAIKQTDAAALTYFSVAIDALAVIVHKDNTLDNISLNQLFDIYSGTVKKFSQLQLTN